MKPIVVGADGSPAALDAVRWAATEARLRHRPLHIVHCWLLVDVLRDPAINDPQLRAACQERADHILRAAASAAADAEPDVVVTTAVVAQIAGWGLLSMADEAEMLVVGARGVGVFTQLLLGSTSREVAARATCPVAVVRRTSGRHERVVVGVDGSKSSLAAVEFAFEEAAWRHATLVAVHGCDSPHHLADLGPSLREHLSAIDADDRMRIKESLAGFGERYPEVKVDEVFAHDAAVPALVREAEAADLIVVGARGRSATTGLLLGSVAHAVLRHADSPVVVVHALSPRS